MERNLFCRDASVRFLNAIGGTFFSRGFFQSAGTLEARWFCDAVRMCRYIRCLRLGMGGFSERAWWWMWADVWTVCGRCGSEAVGGWDWHAHMRSLSMSQRDDMMTCGVKPSAVPLNYLERVGVRSSTFACRWDKS